MKKILLLFCFLVFISSLYSGEWIFTKKSDTNWTEYQIHVSALDSANFLIARSTSGWLQNRYIEKTTDYGQTWDTIFFKEDEIADNASNQLYDVYYKNTDSIFALEGYGEYWKTTNGGTSWEHGWVGDSANTNISNEIVIHNNILYTGGRREDMIVFSTDFGDTWKKISIEHLIDLSDSKYVNRYFSAPIFFEDAMYCYLNLYKESAYIDMQFISEFRLFKTTDEGKSWSEVCYVDENACTSAAQDKNDNIYFLNNYYVTKDTVYKQGDDTPYFRSATYSYILKYDTKTNTLDTIWDTPRGEYPAVRGKLCITESNTFHMMFVNNIFRSEDEGQTWYMEKLRDSKGEMDPAVITDFHDLVMADENHGMIGKTNTYIMYDITTSVTEPLQNVSEMQANPNPIYSGASLTLSYEVLKPGEYSYTITNMAGREFNISIPSEQLTKGQQNISIELPNALTAGSYFLNIKHNGEVTAMKKIVVVK